MIASVSTSAPSCSLLVQSVRLPVDQTGVNAAIAEAFNDIVELLENSTREFDRIGTVVGKEGRINQRASLGAAGVIAASLIPKSLLGFRMPRVNLDLPGIRPF